MKLVLDTSVWVEHLRRDSLDAVLPRLRGSYQLWMDGIVAAELLAGCRSRIERRVVQGLIAPFRKAGRLRVASAEDVLDAGVGLSRLREKGLTLKNAGAALLDAQIAVSAARLGALLVSANVGDYEMLATVVPVSFRGFTAFEAALQSQAR